MKKIKVFIKKMVSVLLSLLLVVSVIQIIALPTLADQSGDFTFTLIDNYTHVKITKYTGVGSTVVIPSTITGMPVTSIASKAFSDCTSISSITIPDSVTIIGYMAFQKCINLRSINIPNSVIIIDDSTFYYCTNLRNITIPNSVTTIGSSAFESCTNLRSITIPSGITSIGSYAFSNCTILSDIIIQEGIKSIGNSTFYNCTSLSSITIPNSVTSIGSSAFQGCTNLSSIIMPNSVTSIGYQTFADCTNLSSITIPNSVTSIGDYAFTGCKSLSSLAIPSIVKSIGTYAFSWCTILNSITIPNSVTSIGASTFYNSNAIVIYCVSGSYSREYAISNNIPFVLNDTEAPTAPTNLTSTNKTDTTVTLRWDVISGAASYNIYENGIKVNSNPILITTFTVTNLTQNTNYNFTAKAVNPIGESEASTPLSVTTSEDSVPTAPTNLISTSKTDTTVILNWDGVSGAVSYNVYKSGIKVNSNLILGTIFTVTDLTPKTTYIFTVKAVNQIGESVASSPFGITTSEFPVSVPTAPTGFSAPVITETVALLSWNTVTGTTGYNVYKDGVKVNATTITTTTYTVYDLYQSTIYNFTVKAINSIGESAASSSCNLTTQDPPFEGELRLGTATGIAWQVLNEAEVGCNIGQYYQIDYNTFESAILGETPGADTYDEIYAAILIAQYIFLNSVITVNNIDITAPKIDSVTGDLTAWQSNVVLTVYATDTRSGIGGYSFDNGETWQNGNTKSYTVNTSGIVIIVRDTAGNQTYYETSINLTNIIIPTIPTAPTGLTSSSITQTTVNLNWNTVAEATGYNVYMNGVNVNTTAIIGTTYTVTGLISLTEYSITVKAINEVGESPASTPLSVTTLVEVIKINLEIAIEEASISLKIVEPDVHIYDEVNNWFRSEIAISQGVYDDSYATQEQVDEAAWVLALKQQIYSYEIEQVRIAKLELLETSTLILDLTGEYIYGLSVGTTVASVKTNFAISSAYTNIVIIRGETTLANTDVVGTGCVISLVINSVTVDTLSVVILCDLTGDGVITLNDLVSARDHLLEVEPLTGANLLAGNLYGEGSITLNCLVGIMSAVCEGGTINQNRKLYSSKALSLNNALTGISLSYYKKDAT